MDKKEFFFFFFFLRERERGEREKWIRKVHNKIWNKHSLKKKKILGINTRNIKSSSFHWKTFHKDSFYIFQCLVAQKKTCQWKTIFGQQKTLIKIRLIFYRLFSKKKIGKQSLFHTLLLL